MSRSPDTRPLVAIPTCVKQIEGVEFHAVGDKYVTSVVAGADAVPVLLPALGPDHGIALLDRFDGFLFTGSPSNVEPHHYGGPDSVTGTLHDPRRDDTTLPLLRAVLDADLPVLCICRGLQELNVVMGGTLHQRVHELPGRLDHREPQAAGAEKYRAVHSVSLVPGGRLHDLAGADQVEVNSLHAQAIDRLGDGLTVEAVAPDGTIEAVRVSASHAFALGVQWHPEHPLALEWPLSRALFAAFGHACRERARRRGSAPETRPLARLA